MTAREVSKLLNLGLNSVYRLARTGHLPHTRTSKKGQIRFDEEQIKKYIEQNTHKGELVS